MYLHLFKCASAEVFAATTDSRGSNLPADACRGAWRYLRGVTVMPADRPSLTLDPLAVMAGVDRLGYHVWGAGLQPKAAPEPAPDSDQDGAAA